MPAAPGQTTGYTSISDYLDANRGTLGNESGALSSDALGQLGAAQDAADKVIAQVQPGQPNFTTTPGYGDAVSRIHDAQDRANGLQSFGGVADALRQHYGDSQNGAAFDASMLEGSPTFGAAVSKAQSLSDYLDKGAAAAAAKSPPSPPPLPGQEAPFPLPPDNDPNTPPGEKGHPSSSPGGEPDPRRKSTGGK
jgi:hypothetical protein